jgi:hypothetical protein
VEIVSAEALSDTFLEGVRSSRVAHDFVARGRIREDEVEREA